MKIKLLFYLFTFLIVLLGIFKLFFYIYINFSVLDFKHGQRKLKIARILLSLNIFCSKMIVHILQQIHC